MSRPPEDPVKRFWRRVKKTRGCWLYQGHQQKRMGYCQFWTPEDGHIYAHVFSFRLHNGKIPRGKKICHTCDTGNCIRPDHLWAGTQKENIQDMIAKGRKPLLTGPRNGMYRKRSLGFTGRRHTKWSRQKMSITRRAVA